jgi:predicted nucleic acid-binding protein
MIWGSPRSRCCARMARFAEWAASSTSRPVVKKVVLDTNLYIDWINRGLHESFLVDPGYFRYLCAVVVMELRAGARTRAGRTVVDRLVRSYEAGGPLVAPRRRVYRAGSALRELRLGGPEVRSAAFVNDVLIALAAREIGATVVTANVGDFEAIRAIEGFEMESP